MPFHYFLVEQILYKTSTLAYPTPDLNSKVFERAFFAVQSDNKIWNFIDFSLNLNVPRKATQFISSEMASMHFIWNVSYAEVTVADNTT